MIQGIDVSHHQGSVDFAKVAASGMRFAIVKATEGVGYVDPRFRENWAKLVDLGHETIYRGAYHYARPSSGGGPSDGENEARDFCAALKAAGDYGVGALPPALDFEEYSESDSKDNVPWIQSFVRVVQQELGRAPMIYTGANVWRYEVGNSTAFVDLPLWQVYYSQSATQPPTMPWPAWTFWQWSGGGSYAYYGPVPGVPSTCDVNRFNGDEAALASLALVKDMAPSFPKPPRPQDLALLRNVHSDVTVRVQGLLLSHGYGPSGLTNSSGKLDGVSGPKTEGYLADFKAKHGLSPDTVVDWPTWWALTYDKLPT